LILGAVTLLDGGGARAGECTAGGDETSNIVLLANELRQPAWSGGLDGSLEPFATLYQESLGILGDGCAGSCPFSGDYGDVTCGDLAADPLDHEGVVEIAGVPDPTAFTGLFAELLPNARWSLGAQGYISPAAGASREATRTFANFEGGFRDVLDVTSAQATPQPLAIDLFVGRGDLGGPVGCFAELLHVDALQTVRFRVREDAVGPGSPVMLVDVTSEPGGDIELGHNVFQVEVSPNAVVYVDLYQSAGVQATGDNTTTSAECDGGLATLDTRLDLAGTLEDGIQVFLSPAPTLSVVSRGGLGYQPVPEPGAGIAGATAIAVLALQACRLAPRRAVLRG
jgi:hypothetical protein